MRLTVLSRASDLARVQAVSARWPAAQAAWFARFFRALIARGIYFPPSAFEVGFVSLAHDAAGLARAADAIVAAAIEVHAS